MFTFLLIVALGIIPMGYSLTVAMRMIDMCTCTYESAKALGKKPAIWFYLRDLFSYGTFWAVMKDDIRYGDFNGLLVVSLFPIWGYPLTIMVTILIDIVIHVLVLVSRIMNKN